MPLKVSFPVAAKGNTVPYPPFFDHIRQNHGYVDARGKPGVVVGIPEAQESPALYLLLQRLAQPDSLLISLGCDLGQHLENKKPLNRRRVAGGYVQIACPHATDDDVSLLRKLSIALKGVLDEDVGEDCWNIRFELSAVRLEFDERIDTHSVWVWFFASSSTEKKAFDSRERILLSLLRGISCCSP